jgi:hypothetical protein
MKYPVLDRLIAFDAYYANLRENIRIEKSVLFSPVVD